MRRAYYDIGWILAGDGTLQGVSLGYDHCAQHEWGIASMLDLLGVALPEFPLGVGDRQVRHAPAKWLALHEFSCRPRDQRRKAYPAALLVLHEDPVSREPGNGVQLMRACSLDFHSDPTDSFYKQAHDLAASWDRESFALLARGEANIARLRELHAAFLACDIAVAVPWARSFFVGGVSFVLPSRIPEEARALVLEQDLAHKELHDAARATGIEALLAAAGKACHALSPAWFDEAQDELIFFLNPVDQRCYRHGWFTLAELQEWARDTGPVLRDEALEAFAARPEHYNWSCRLLEGMTACGVAPRYHEKLVWCDAAKTVPGLRYRATRAGETLLPSGDYPFEELMAKYAIPLPADRAGSTATTAGA
jgi:hypothetical protein